MTGELAEIELRDGLERQLDVERRRAQLSSPHTPEGASRRACVAEIERRLAELIVTGSIVAQTSSAIAAAQLTVDGAEILLAAIPSRASFTPAQREILRLAREHGRISPVEAGTIVHAHRTPPCARCSCGACGFTSSDGADALKRLRKRGLMRRARAGVWEPAAC